MPAALSNQISKAIEQAITKAKQNDVVLIAGKGHETYQEFEDTVVPFDDTFHAQEALEVLTRHAHGLRHCLPRGFLNPILWFCHTTRRKKPFRAQA